MASRQKKRSASIETPSVQRQPRRAFSRYFGEQAALKIEPLYESAVAQSRPAMVEETMASPKASRLASLSKKQIASAYLPSLSRRPKRTAHASTSAKVQVKVLAFNVKSKEELPAPARSALTERTVVEQQMREHILKPILLPYGNTGVVPGSDSRPRNAWQSLQHWASMMVRRLMRMLPTRARQKLTARGQQALAQLESLYALLQAETDEDGMDLVALKAAFGTAYYSVLEDSRRHYRAHKGREPEDYRTHFDHFLKELP